MVSEDHANQFNDVPAQKIRTLSEADAQALDALLAGSRVSAQAGAHAAAYAGDPQRIERVSKVLSLLDALPVAEPSNDLVARTMTAIEQTRQRERFASQVQMLAGSDGSLGVGWRQILSAAAVFIIGISLLLPFLSRSRAEARRVACATNLQTAGSAFGSYAADNLGMLPRGKVAPGTAWWRVGQDVEENAPLQSNSAHLYLLIRQNYLSPDQLACPENAHALTGEHEGHRHDWPTAQAVSYSYQNQYTRTPLRLQDAPNLALLADKNPLFLIGQGKVAFDERSSRVAPSRVHDNRGQNVLTADGAVTWSLRPLLRRGGQGTADNIWVAKGVDRYTGNETPTTPDDSFLVP